MTWEETREIEEAHQSEDPDQTEDNAPKTCPSNDTRVSPSFCVSNRLWTYRQTCLRELRTAYPSRSTWWLASGGAGDPRTTV